LIYILNILITNKHSNMTQKEYNKIVKHLKKVEKIMNYKHGLLVDLLEIPKPCEPSKKPTVSVETKSSLFKGPARAVFNCYIHRH
jgi:hypothetical protein